MKIVLIYWGIMLLAYFAGLKLSAYGERFWFCSRFTMGLVYMIIFLMGIRMGTNRKIMNHFADIGFQAFVMTVFCVGGSMLAIFALRKFFKMDKYGSLKREIKEEAAVSSEQAGQSGMKSGRVELQSTVVILIMVTVGILIGNCIILKHFPDYLYVLDKYSNHMMTVCLCVMMGLIGFDLGLSGKAAECLKSAGAMVIVFPAAAVLGTLVMGTVSGMLLGFSVREGLAISAGFGWYTYAPAVISGAGSEYAIAGTVAFVHNVIRETASIILIPLCAKRIGYLEATAMPGISAMDICMPIIERSCREDTIIYAFLTGIFMNITASIGVPVIMGI